MNRCSIQAVRELLDTLAFKPSRVLGQNFLIDRNLRDLIVALPEVNSDQHLLEVGPGLGTLTEALIGLGASVTAIEKDDRLYAYLTQAFASVSNLTLIHGDALTCNWLELAPDIIVSNLPYSVGSRLLMDWVTLENPPQEMVLMFQKDVVQRLVAEPGNKTYGLLSIIPRLMYDVAVARHLKPGCFYPPPKIDSAVVHLVRKKRPLVPPGELKPVLRLCRHAFSQRRKQIHKLLTNPQKTILLESGFTGNERPEQLPPEIWVALARS